MNTTTTNTKLTSKQILDLTWKLLANKTDSYNLIKETMKANYDNQEYWEYCINDVKLSCEFILDNLYDINFKYLFKYQVLPSEITSNPAFINIIIKNNLINDLVDTQILNTNVLIFLIKQGVNDDFWMIISKKQNLTMDFMNIYADKLVWEYITEKQIYDIEFLTTHVDKIVWQLLPLNIPVNKSITNTTINNYIQFPIWEYIGLLQHISDQTLIQYIEYINEKSAVIIIKNRDVSDELLDKLINKFDTSVNLWNSISQLSNLNNEFLEKYKTKINWDLLSENYDFNENELHLYNKYINYEKLNMNVFITDEWIKVAEQYGYKISILVDE